MSKFAYALSAFSASIMGVGLFALPYITSKTGLWVMLGYFLVLGTIVAAVHLFFGELALKTPDYKRLPGFAKIYLGKGAEKLAVILTVISIFGAILAYLTVGGSFLAEILSPFFGGNGLIYTLLYFAAGAVLIFFGSKAIAKAELWAFVIFILILSALFFNVRPLIKFDNLFPIFDAKNLFLPYGAVLFSLWGANFIPEVEEMLGDRKKLLKKTIILGTIIPVLIYIFFIYMVLGVTGPATSDSAIPGLKRYFNDGIISLGLFFGVLTTFRAFIAMGLNLKHIFWYDLKVGKNLAWAIACFVPLTLFLIGIKKFVPIISFIGGVGLGIDGILIILMYQKIKPRSVRIYTIPLMLIFALGIIYEITYFVR